jgi:hypothetical protein
MKSEDLIELTGKELSIQEISDKGYSLDSAKIAEIAEYGATTINVEQEGYSLIFGKTSKEDTYYLSNVQFRDKEGMKKISPNAKGYEDKLPHKLEFHMSKEEVLYVLGEPEQIKNVPMSENKVHWTYDFENYNLRLFFNKNTFYFLNVFY